MEKKTSLGNISGKVTLKGKGVAGIFVVLRSNDGGRLQPVSYHATTDQDGTYRISNVPPGSYQVSLAAPTFVVSTGSPVAMVILGEGESVEDINFDLTKGGVITGRITNSEGEPLIEQQVNLLPAETTPQNAGMFFRTGRQFGQTDDRGIYRIFGLPEGKYKVAVGPDENDFMGGRRRFRQTFYPNVTEISKATIVELSEGSEVKRIDISVDATQVTGKYAVSGRIVDRVTGQPVPNLRIGLQRISGNDISSVSGRPDFVSDNEGQFRVENLAPGNYGVFVSSMQNNELRADTVPFEIRDGDVTGLFLRTYIGASLSGEIVFEGSNDKSMRAKLGQLMLQANISNEAPRPEPGRTVRIGQDATFHISGLKAGIVNFYIGSPEGGPVEGLSISRIEREGIVQPPVFEVKDGEQVTGLKLVLTAGNGTVRGVVKVINGEAPATAPIVVWFTNTGSDLSRLQSQPVVHPVVDSRGHFVAEGLAAGTYEINASMYVPGARNRPPSAKQQVTVTDGGVTEVIITLDLTAEPDLH